MLTVRSTLDCLNELSYLFNLLSIEKVARTMFLKVNELIIEPIFWKRI